MLTAGPDATEAGTDRDNHGESMRSFSLYEFASTVVPGTTCMIAFLIATGVPAPVDELPTSLQVAIYAVLSYACGQVMQMVGKEAEWLALWGRRGEPVAWLSPLKRQTACPSPTTCKCRRIRRLLTPAQVERITGTEAWREHAPCDACPPDAWEHWLRHESVRCRKTDKASRLNYLTSIYALCRGLVVAFLLLGIAFFVKQSIPAGSGCVIAASTLLVRVEQLKISSTQEILLQMLERGTADDRRELESPASPSAAAPEQTNA